MKDSSKETLSKEVLKNISALHRIAFSLCENKQEAEELVSETVVKAFEKRQQIRDADKIKQWLFRILNNTFISNYRKAKKYRKINLPDISDSSFSLFEQIAGSSFTDRGTPEKSFMNKITREKIHAAINELHEEFRTALLLCDVEDFSYAEIASITKIPVGTVRSRIARARNLLQQKLWIQACEMGIKVKTKEKEHVCACGKEELESLNITSS